MVQIHTLCNGDGCPACAGVGVLPDRCTDLTESTVGGWAVCPWCEGGSTRPTNPDCGHCRNAGWVR